METSQEVSAQLQWCPSMHHALYIEETLLNIFSYCYIPKHRQHSYLEPQRWYANVHLAALARTCKRFKEPALDMIWAELSDLYLLYDVSPKQHG